MMFSCPVHTKLTPGLRVSPDLPLEPGATLPQVRTVWFEYRGERIDEMVVSLNFAAQEDLPDTSTIPLPGQYPDWYFKLKEKCVYCVHDAYDVGSEA